MNTPTETGAPAPAIHGRVVDLTELNKRFTCHPPHGDQPQRYVTIREAAHTLASTILFNTPPSREQAVALTKLEEACFWANASIARNEAPAPTLEDVELIGLEPHQQRVVLERRELWTRYEKLREFVSHDEPFLTLPDDEQARLSRQLDLMGQMLDVLGQRIANFK